jgi:transposase
VIAIHRPNRAALLIALIQTPHRFRTKRQLWTYSGFGIQTHSSAEQRFIKGELTRANKPASIRGLNHNHNHDLKNLFKSAATVAAAKPGPFQEFYDALVAKGIKPEMARLTLARKIAAITLVVWKKGVRFDAQYLKPQTAWVSLAIRSIPRDQSWWWLVGFLRHSGTRASLS